LVNLTPSPDDNVAYVFHLYAPMVFTHQGADWGDPTYESTRGLQYPPSYPNLTIIQNRAPMSLKPDLAAYGMLGRDVIIRNIQPALDWSRRYQKHLVVTEFGVYRAFAPPASRAAWLHDARVALEKDGIGWTLWEYNGGFGIKSDLDLGCGPLPVALGLCQPPP
jgi:endoglucanase